MSRTYREVPASPFKDREEKNANYSEERRHPEHTETVRDKDNHGCMYSCPKSHRKHGIRKHRSHERQSIREIEKLMRKNPSRKIGDEVFYIGFDDTEIMLPRPKEYREYYW